MELVGDAKSGDVEEAMRDLLEKVSPEVYLKAVEVDVRLKKGGKKLLDGVSVDFGPGELAAIMGPSGAGKTTLLNVLSARMRSHVAEVSKGGIFANGVELVTTDDFSAWGTVAPQEDVVLPMLTVLESLRYAARLRGSTPGRVEALLKTFELEDRMHLAAGHLSGGQRKRLSIAMELVHAPSVILVDEPTSGLDSRVALAVVQTLRDITQKTRTNIAATIHQPSVESFLCFDRFILITAGRIAFRGSVGAACTVFKESCGGHEFIRNPADAAIDQAVDVAKVVQKWDDLQRDDVAFQHAEAQRLATFDDLDRSKDVTRKQIHQGMTTKRAEKIWVLFQRTLVQSFRLQGTFQVKSAAVTALVYGLVFFQQQNTQERAQMKIAILFLSHLMNGLVPGIIMSLFVPLERPTLRREAWNGVWKLSEYLAARTAAAAIIHICSVTLYSVVIYNMVDMHGDFGRFLYPLMLLGCITQQIGLCLGSVFPAAVKSVPAFLPINIGSVIFAGFFFQKAFLTKNAQKVTYPFWYISWYRYAFALLAVNEFEHGNFNSCDIGEGDFCPYAGHADFLGQRHVPRKVVADDVLKINLAFTKNFHWLIMLTFFVGFYILTYILVQRITLKP